MSICRLSQGCANAFDDFTRIFYADPYLLSLRHGGIRNKGAQPLYVQRCPDAVNIFLNIIKIPLHRCQNRLKVIPVATINSLMSYRQLVKIVLFMYDYMILIKSSTSPSYIISQGVNDLQINTSIHSCIHFFLNTFFRIRRIK